MRYKVLICILLLYITTPFLCLTAKASNGVVILTYHDVGDIKGNPWTVTRKNLEDHFIYLKANGYHPISLDEYIAANRGEVSLPDKSVLITFDDGYISFYNEVFPLLKKYNYPAVFAVVTSWVDFGSPQFVSWQQIREMEASGLVAIASHSHQAHRYVPINPQGDKRPMLASLIYSNGRYESFDSYMNRVRADLRQSQQVLEKNLGHKVKALAWPYGEYTKFALDIGREAGFEAFFRLTGGMNQVGTSSLLEANRGIIFNNPKVNQFARFVKTEGLDAKPIKAAQLDIDSLYDDANPLQTEINIKLTMDRLENAKVNTVFLQAFCDEEGNGNIKSVYFNTSEAPVKADIFSHIAAVLHDNGFKVYAWMPSLSGQWLIEKPGEDSVLAYDLKGKGWYNRATPFKEATVKKLQKLYSDLAAYCYIDGILIQDDLYLNDYEDFSPAAKAIFQKKFGQELTPDLLKNAEVRWQWTEFKTAVLCELSENLIKEVRLYRPATMAARNIYSEVITERWAEEWYAQNYKQYLKTYDYTVIMAYPYMEKQEKNQLNWLGTLADTALKSGVSADKIIFKLQTFDWDKKRWITNQELKNQVQLLRTKGAVNFAYYPEKVFREKDSSF